MKKSKLMMIFFSLMLCMSCQDADMAIGKEGSGCGTSSKAFKKIKKLEGIFLYNEFEEQYTITVDYLNTYDSQDRYLICYVPENIDLANI